MTAKCWQVAALVVTLCGCAHQHPASALPASSQSASRMIANTPSSAPLNVATDDARGHCDRFEGESCPLQLEERTVTGICRYGNCVSQRECARQCGAQIGLRLADYALEWSQEYWPRRRDVCESDPGCKESELRLFATELISKTRPLEICVRSCLAPGKHIGEENVPVANDNTTTAENACSFTDACREAGQRVGSRFPLPGKGIISVCDSAWSRQGRACLARGMNGEFEGKCFVGQCVPQGELAETCWHSFALDVITYFWQLAQSPLASKAEAVDTASWAALALNSVRRMARSALRCAVDGSADLLGGCMIPHWDGSVPAPSRMLEP